MLQPFKLSVILCLCVLSPIAIAWNFSGFAWILFTVNYEIREALSSSNAKIRNKFVSPYPTDPVKISQLKKIYWKFAVTFFFFSFCWKFHILDSFRQKIDIFALLSTSLSSKKKAYLKCTYPLPKLWVG
jgi:hypothetical protein